MTQTEVKHSWDHATLTARIADGKEKRRHAAGSPNPTEIAAYARGIALPRHHGRALVMGMTPELRRLALQSYRQVISLDRNPEAVRVYRDWIDPSDAPREQIVLGDWRALADHLPCRVNTALGDGIFANLSEADEHLLLLRLIGRSLEVEGKLVTRLTVIPEGFEAADYTPDDLTARYRRGELDDAEFGFALRKMSLLDRYYDPATYVLDNAAIFADLDQRHQRGELSDGERAAAWRYHFAGPNILLPQEKWEDLLSEAGFEFRIQRCHGKHWYTYYLVYECRRA